MNYARMIVKYKPIVRLFPNGRVLYSQRLTIRASCVMDLKDFPMDRQQCPLQFGSCMILYKQKYLDILNTVVAYPSTDIRYQWTSGRGVNIASDMKLSQFDLISTPVTNGTVWINRGMLVVRLAPQCYKDMISRRSLNFVGLF